MHRPTLLLLAILIVTTTAVGARRPPKVPARPKSAAAPATPSSEGTATSVAPAQPPVIVAVIEGHPVGLPEIDLLAAADIALLRQFEYDLRQRTLDGFIQRALLERDAKERGLSVDAVLEAEVESRLGEPTPEELAALWADAPPFVKQGTSMEASRESLVGEFRQRRRASLEEAFQKRLRTKYAGLVQVQLESPRKEVPSDGSPARGPEGAPVTVVAFTDYQCPGCARADASLRALEERHPGRLRIVHHDFPNPHHEGSAKAAEAARCAGEQDLFWPYHDALLSDFTRSTEEGLFATARDVGVEVEAFRSCLESGRQSAAVAKDLALARTLGLSGTPWLYINGLPLPGVYDVNELNRVLSAEFGRLRR